MRITFIGGGNMAQAIAGGLIKNGFDAKSICAVEPLAEARARLAQQFGVRAVASAAEAAPLGDLVVMAVKPQQMREAAAAIKPLAAGSLVLSIAAGTRLADLRRWLGGHALLARCMPNTPALIGEGISGLYCAPQVSPEQRRMAVEVLQAVGEVIEVQSEALLDPVTAVSGSGPAYVFLFIEALQRAAKELGLSADQARALSLQTFAGAARLAASSGEDVGVLRERVTSKGGTTERALASMRDDKVVDAIVRAIHAANTRAAELGDQLGKD
ncbi:MAG: pyrroline-5-carboxylate reductase [Betaproteobacteria bacterium RIFCSPLOWO2_02_FULL_62_17]|nr:MAG: pyrroline-5-carboxylate reductase [Betaproteobacteria bacterium RIFCSPLOWO2_02_FULL_62_17]